MRITMICIGSTGDVRPYMVLGRELKSRGHDVAICAFADFEQAVLGEGLRFYPVSGDVKHIMANLMTGATGFGFLRQVENALQGCLEPFLADIEAACDDAGRSSVQWPKCAACPIFRRISFPWIRTPFPPCPPRLFRAAAKRGTGSAIRWAIWW